ncbi:MAG TPA: hypothetical protein VL022_07120 [Moheibacter sp.]|nr:hypothetical protein [Moheibacter sp.]
MQTVEINADAFFNLLKSHGVSMWDLFEKMIDGEERQLLFLNSEEKVIAHYVLPVTIELLRADKEHFHEALYAALSKD